VDHRDSGPPWTGLRRRPEELTGALPTGAPVHGSSPRPLRKHEEHDGLRKLEEEASFGKYAKAAQAEWAERTHGGLRAKWPGLLEAGPVGPESEKKNDFQIKFDF
jgi:hypothetical protein